MKQFDIKFKLLNERAVLPKRGTSGSAGLDLTCTSRSFDEYNKSWKYKTGLAVEIPKGFVGLLFPRSSICKKDLILSNAVGVLDSDYRGEICAVFKQIGEGYEIYEIGERCCQLVIIPYLEANPIEATELSQTERGVGGYGSTGK